MAKNPLPSPELLRQLLRYEPETGKLFWRERDTEGSTESWRTDWWNRRYAGKEALTAISNCGYLKGTVMGAYCKAHRAAWAITNGQWPSDQIDHIDGDKTNNRIANLRVVSNSINQKNRGMQSNNLSGFTGVSWHKVCSKWCATIGVDGRQVHLGTFESLDDAIAARKRAEIGAGYTERHGT